MGCVMLEAIVNFNRPTLTICTCFSPPENSRKSDFKKGLDTEEGRRRRNDTTISLRKNKREEGISKRRAMTAATHSSSMEIGTNPDKGDTTNVIDSGKEFTTADIPGLMAIISQPNVSDDGLLEVARGFRKILSKEDNPPVQAVLASGVLPAFVQMLQLNDKPKVQFEAAWALTNIASTSETKAIVDAGTVPYLAHLLCSPDAEVREQCAWCLGNIAGDSSALRDIVLSSGAMQPILQNIVQPANATLFDNCVWALSNFCRGKPQPQLDQVSPAIPILASILKGVGSTSSSAKVDALWALSYISDGDDERIQAVLETEGLIHTLVEMLDGDTNLVAPALRTVGNVVSGSDTQTQAVIDAGVMSKMLSLINSPKRMIRKEACWVISNIAAGTESQIKTVLKTKGLMLQIVDLSIESEWEVRKEAIWVISNVVSGGNDYQVMSAVEAGAIEAICSILNVNDTKMILVALETIDNILKLGMKLGKDYISFVDECDGLSMIEALQEHENDDIYKQAIHIIEAYFGCEDEIEDENLAPSASGSTFAFGVPQKVLGGTGFPSNASSSAQPMTPFNFSN